jgi:hypothetical protein
MRATCPSHLVLLDLKRTSYEAPHISIRKVKEMDLEEAEEN